MMSLISLPPELILEIFNGFKKEELADYRLIHRQIASILLPNVVKTIQLPLSNFPHVELEEPLYNEDAEDFTGDEDDFATSDRLKTLRCHVKRLIIVYETSDIDNGVKLTSRSIPTLLESLPNLEKVVFNPADTHTDINVRIMLVGLRARLKGVPFHVRLPFSKNPRNQGVREQCSEPQNSAILRELPSETEQLSLRTLPENGAQTLNKDLADSFSRCPGLKFLRIEDSRFDLDKSIKTLTGLPREDNAKPLEKLRHFELEPSHGMKELSSVKMMKSLTYVHYKPKNYTTAASWGGIFAGLKENNIRLKRLQTNALHQALHSYLISEAGSRLSTLEIRLSEGFMHIPQHENYANDQSDSDDDEEDEDSSQNSDNGNVTGNENDDTTEESTDDTNKLQQLQSLMLPFYGQVLPQICEKLTVLVLVPDTHVDWLIGKSGTLEEYAFVNEQYKQLTSRLSLINIPSPCRFPHLRKFSGCLFYTRELDSDSSPFCKTIASMDKVKEFSFQVWLYWYDFDVSMSTKVNNVMKKAFAMPNISERGYGGRVTQTFYNIYPDGRSRTGCDFTFDAGTCRGRWGDLLD